MSDQDANAAFAWLEGLAVKQGAEQGLQLKPEERLEQPPEWVKDTSAKILADQEGENVEPITHGELNGEKDTSAEIPAQPQLVNEPLVASQMPIEEQALTPQEPSESGLPDWLLEETGFDALRKPAEPSINYVTEEKIAEKTEDTSFLPTEPSSEWLAEQVETITKPTDLETPTTGQIDETVKQATVEAPEPVSGLEFEPKPNIGEDIGELQISAEENKAAEQEQIEAIQLKDEFDIDLTNARNFIVSGKNAEALHYYSKLVKNKKHLPEVIKDINEELQKNPMDVSLWTCLGDAYMNADQLQQALDAYTKAEELLR